MTASDMFEQPTWEERYGAHTAMWSGRPNPQLVAEAAHLTPGRALDVGSGEGADAIWLAARGWTVTAVDFSRTALQRAAEHADEVSIAWTNADLRTTSPEGPFDLVSAQYMHLLTEPRRALFARLADAVAPGGTLLVVGHHPADVPHGNWPPEIYYTAEEIADDLDPAAWSILAADARPRNHRHADGTETTVRDAVLRARRRM